MLKVTARAKINWSLDITGILPNGYHAMDMLMSNVELADKLYIAPHTNLQLTMQGGPDLAAQDNIVFQAAHALLQHTGYNAGANITLQKHIPHGAGLGGGSADAAAALIGLNHFWGLHLSLDTLHKIAQSLGADVPFFLTGGFARIGGFGEIVHSLPALHDLSLLIIQPCKPQPTAEVFAWFDTLTSVVHPNTAKAQSALLAADYHQLSLAAGNVLQQAIEPHAPPIAEAIAALDACGATFAAMTGSGSAVFGVFADDTTAASASRTLHKRWKKCWLTHTTTQSITMEEAEF